MLDNFLFCFKHKFAAVLMACFCLIAGVFGLTYFSLRVYYRRSLLDEQLLVVCVFYLLLSLILASAIIWECSLLVLIFDFVHISTLSSLIVITVIYMEHNSLNWLCLFTIIGVGFYWSYCIHLFYKQLRLKEKSYTYYIDGDVYSVCNKLYINKSIRFV
ncbi:uncharacterized protein LOC143193896 [Rhynchophorus ferrugineus]|uniref:uncharacterized protein LOC143193896 n=1 Tax=Rhynchophorus ferrugineus TaxID=354439 RepID=UPI003FCEA964